MSLEAGAVFFFKAKRGAIAEEAFRAWAQFGFGSVRKIHRDTHAEVETHGEAEKASPVCSIGAEGLRSHGTASHGTAKEVEIHFTQFKGFKVEKRIPLSTVISFIQKGYIVVRPPLPKGVDRRKQKEERRKRISSNAYLILRREVESHGEASASRAEGFARDNTAVCSNRIWLLVCDAATHRSAHRNRRYIYKTLIRDGKYLLGKKVILTKQARDVGIDRYYRIPSDEDFVLWVKWPWVIWYDIAEGLLAEGLQSDGTACDSTAKDLTFLTPTECIYFMPPEYQSLLNDIETTQYLWDDIKNRVSALFAKGDINPTMSLYHRYAQAGPYLEKRSFAERTKESRKKILNRLHILWEDVSKVYLFPPSQKKEFFA